MDAPQTQVIGELAERLRPAGIDLVQPMNGACYDAAIAPEYRLPDIGRRGPLTLVLASTAGEAPSPPASCADCAELCKPAFERALAASTAPAGRVASDAGDPIVAHWCLWLAVRDACPIGREHRYPDELIRYLYTKDRAVLRDAVRAASER